MNDLYEDIINHPHHVSQKHPQMSRQSCAAQFSPFSALTGYDDLVTESARTTDTRRELTDDERSEINLKLAVLERRKDEQPEVTIRYFVTDERKNGGSYNEVSGIIKNIMVREQLLIMDSGITILFEDITNISGVIFSELLYGENV